MSTARLEKMLEQNAKNIITGMTFAIKDIRGSYERRPVEEIYSNNEIYFHAHKVNLLKGNFQPLVDFADMITRKRALDRFRLHELLRAGYSFKKVVYPILVRECWEDTNDMVKSFLSVDKSVDRLVVNLAQAFVHYAKGYITSDPLEFPVWLESAWRRARVEGDL